MNFSFVDYKSDILKTTLDDFDFSNPDIEPELLEQTLTSIMVRSRGLGLAANQVGYNKRVFAMGTEKSATCLFNPVIIETSEQQDIEYEGCLSFPGLFIEVERPLGVIVECFDVKGDKQHFELQGFDARVFLHEHEHLEGHVFLEAVSKLKLERAIKKANKVGLKYKLSDFSTFF